MNVRIVVDYRETPSGILEVLRIRDEVKVEEKQLSIGGYLVNDDITVERKTAKDFIISIIDGRHWKEEGCNDKKDFRVITTPNKH